MEHTVFSAAWCITLLILLFISWTLFVQRSKLEMNCLQCSLYSFQSALANFHVGSDVPSKLGSLSNLVIYRQGSAAALSSLFDEFADLLDHVTIMGDVNLHLESPTDAGAIRFSSLPAMNNLVQVVQSPTHTAGHQLDVVRSDSMVTSINGPPPVLSDHDRRGAGSTLLKSI